MIIPKLFNLNNLKLHSIKRIHLLFFNQFSFEISSKYYDQLDKIKKKSDLLNNNNFSEFNQLISKLKNICDEIKEIENLSQDKTDESLIILINDEFKSLERNFIDFKKKALNLFIKGPFDHINEINMEFESGAGGLEAMLFNQELVNFYINFLQALNLKVDILELNKIIDDNCLKSAILKVSGKNCFQYLQNEAGVHRVQRIPETDKLKRIHTSAIAIKVLPIFPDFELNLDKKFLKIDTMRSSGPGGQNVNKVETCVRIVHLPTGLDVKCQDTRDQLQNKTLALERLKIKLSALKFKKLIDLENKFRQNQVKSVDPSEKIRTFNYLQDRITDHRLKKDLFNLKAFFNGESNDILFEWIKTLDQQKKLLQYNDLCKNLNL